MISKEIYNIICWDVNERVFIEVAVDARNSTLIYPYSDYQNISNKWNLMLYDYGNPIVVYHPYHTMEVMPEFEKYSCNIKLPQYPT